MTTGYQEFPVTEPFITSHPKLLSNDKAALTTNAGTAFPDAANTFEGMYCWRTDEKKLYRYSGSAWAVADIQGNAATATKLATARTITLGTAVTATAKAFDGTENVTIPVASLKEAYLTWGGRNYSYNFGPLDASLVSQLGANRFAYASATGITVEYSTDGGTTWTDYGASDSQKVQLFTTQSSFSIGKKSSSVTVNDQLRITIDTGKSSVYTEFKKFVIFISSNGAKGSWCTLDVATNGAPTTFVTKVSKQAIDGWTGYNIINTAFTSYGNSSAQNQFIRFTFGITGLNTSYSNALTVMSIYGYGGMGWNTPNSQLPKTGHLYSYDAWQNVTFPATVTASKFVGNAATTTVAGLMSATDKAKLDVAAPLASPALTGTPTAPTAAAGTNTTQVATTAFVTTAVSNATSEINTALRNLTSTWGGTLP